MGGGAERHTDRKNNRLWSRQGQTGLVSAQAHPIIFIGTNDRADGKWNNNLPSVRTWAVASTFSKYTYTSPMPKF